MREENEVSECGTKEKVLSEFMLIALLGRLEEEGPGDEARLEELTLSGYTYKLEE